MGARTLVDRTGVEALVLTLAAGLIVVGGLAADPPAASTRGLDALAAGLLALGALVVAVGARFPAAAALAALTVTFAWYGIGYESGVVNVVSMLAFYRLGVSERQDRKVAVTMLAVLATLMLMMGVGDESWQDTAGAAGYVVMAVLFGELLRNRRLVLAQYAERAARAEADAERRLVEERLSIARDVHDVLAHTVSVMTVQAGVAADSLDRDRARTEVALRSIRAEGRRAMDEVRAIVAVLRSSAGPVGGVAPSPRIDRLGELADAARAQGLAVDLRVDVPEGAVSELAELTVFRVVQEALTNVLRHADGATTAVVTVGHRDGGVTAEVRDDGRAVPPVRPGYGLRGMAERVEAVGGALHHGVPEHGGFVVRASLPADGGAR